MTNSKDSNTKFNVVKNEDIAKLVAETKENHKRKEVTETIDTKEKEE